MPYWNATYASNVDKIFATMGPYVVRCNAITGEREAITKLNQGEPTYGPLPIVYHPDVGKLYVGGGGNNPCKQIDFSPTADPPVFRDIYEIDPSTMAVTVCGFIAFLIAQHGTLDDGLRGSANFMMVDGSYIYLLQMSNVQGQAWFRMHAGTHAFNGGGGSHWRAEQMSVSASYGDYVYRLNPSSREINYYDKTGIIPNGGILGHTDLAPYTPVGICQGFDNKNWIVCGDTNLLRQESLTNNDITVFDLGAVIGPSVPPDPCRIRSIGGKLYMPCMSANGIIVHTPGAPINTAVWKDGFEGPIDVMSTGSKIFAVQNSPVGLKEIT